MKVLYVHHARNFDSEQVYLSNNHRKANLALYGAQEMDTWAGIRLLSEFGDVERYEICPNLSSARHVNSQGFTISQVTYSQGLIGDPKFSSSKLINLFTNNFDSSVAQWRHLPLVKHFQFIVNNYDLIWVDTQFYEPLLANVQTPVVIRSVNFEPRHVLGEDESISRYLKVFPKIWTEKRVAKNRTFVSISPRDQRSYKRIGIRSRLMPLRQLGYLNDIQYSGISDPDTIYFTGSTYDVLHNRRNLNFIVEELAPKLNRLFPDIKIAITGNRLPIGIRLPNNVQYLGFLPDLQERLMGSLAVLVPYFGGAGMQSKVFEALTIGSTVVANPDVMAGYPFLPNRDFLPAITANQFVNSIREIRRDRLFASQISSNGKNVANKLFSKLELHSNLDCILQNI